MYYSPRIARTITSNVTERSHGFIPQFVLHDWSIAFSKASSPQNAI